MTARIAVGQLVGVFGIKGWLKVKSNTEPAENIINYKPWYLKTQHGLKEVEVDEYAFRPQGLMVHIKGYDDRDQAVALGKATIEVDKSLLPELDAQEFYWHQLIGLKVITVFGGDTSESHAAQAQCLGSVKSLLETGANDVLVVEATPESIDDRERLLPYVPDEFVLAVDLEAGEIRVNWDPEF
ncbi:ribosome maturation factor RimM [Marinagarivorans algicola]|uniref:ribosome maturation factor RimM n=1 Tax=Marinagarivorans algicola TaxID=1513270 RepID=UPI0006B4787B|nr:ribosome maturation factor RimM [Marinagarivorans algicola]